MIKNKNVKLKIHINKSRVMVSLITLITLDSSYIQIFFFQLPTSLLRLPTCLIIQD